MVAYKVVVGVVGGVFVAVTTSFHLLGFNAAPRTVTLTNRDLTEPPPPHSTGGFGFLLRF